MAVEVVMPKLGMAMKEGTVAFWNKNVGDPVEKGEAIASVNSEKIEIDVESPAEGTVLTITVPEGQGVPPGTVICYVGNPGEEVITNEVNVQENKKESERNESTSNLGPSTLPVNQDNARLKISPVARKMAQDANLTLDNIQGTGPGGRITKENVEEAIKRSQSTVSTSRQKEDHVVSPAQLEEKKKQVPVSGMRKVITSRMQDSLQNSAQLTITMKADVTDLIAMQKQANSMLEKRAEIKLTMTDFVARSVILSLKEHPQMNSAFVEDTIHIFEQIHLGMAVALEKGLVVPVIQHAHMCTVLELSQQSKELAARARLGQLTNEEMQGSTFTISNLGGYGVEFFTPILNPPEAGILGIGAAFDSPIYMDGQVTIRSMLPLSLTFDHRILDGAPASAFLRTVKQYLEQPLIMLL
ncbi:dihydrolipoamide acetyltransferase family protein [Aneurinibacillus sp. Ricciae_BoGa-3]|uniref:dihydrolipoamide acetyltransferase family protein n=1 Tax=Aneurinibacillus sp. Ricciae_BoGa-3 TaxID=3022697 RepID=UPI002340C206|nr:dihydrolipoamide acetyltransferase family protein [Aneurinibacillus sp. Ricciae_BoGa-3]WCK56636.1 dihydrolipoamide acetyltransferase family protein [Aneurinibacillus sp. Ricciae_BoGa-3]